MQALHFTLTTDDFWRLQLHAYRRRLVRRYKVLVAYFILVAIVSLFPGMHFPLLLVAVVLLVACLCGLTLILMRIGAAKSTGALQNRGTHTVSIDENGITYNTEQSKNNMS